MYNFKIFENYINSIQSGSENFVGVEYSTEIPHFLLFQRAYFFFGGGGRNCKYFAQNGFMGRRR